MDALSNPLRLHITAGQVNDSTQAEALIQGWLCQFGLADRGYASYGLLAHIRQHGAQAVIPPHPRAQIAWEYDTWLYRERHLVECCINKLKQFRRVFTRFDKLACRCAGFVYLASALLWLR